MMRWKYSLSIFIQYVLIENYLIIYFYRDRLIFNKNSQLVRTLRFLIYIEAIITFVF
jgi:hypothetical protein